MIRVSRFHFFLFIFLFPFFSHAQEQARPESGYIEVTGNAREEVVPDEIFLTITIRERLLNNVKVTLEEQERILKSSLTSLGIDQGNLTLSGAQAAYIRVPLHKKNLLKTREYSLKVRDAAQVEEVFGVLEEMKITDAFIDRVNYSGLDSLRKEVWIKAIKAAREKADYLLAAIGQQAGPAFFVREENGSRAASARRRYRADEHYGEKEEPEEAIQFKKIEVESNVFVKFQIQKP